MPRFNVVDQDNYVAPDGLELDKKDIVERDGYRDTKTQVEILMQAGVRLNEFRREEYDDLEGVSDDELFNNPTVNQSYDIIDAVNDLKNIKPVKKVEEKKDEEKEEVKEVKTDG